jgi:hypothetical protein
LLLVVVAFLTGFLLAGAFAFAAVDFFTVAFF